MYLVPKVLLFRNWLNNQTSAVLLKVIPGFYKNFSKNNLSISTKTYEKYSVRKEHCIAHHDDNMCFPPNCKNHIELIGDIKELLQKMDAFCFNYQHVDCLYTYINYRFSGRSVVESEQLFANMKRVVHFNHQHRGVDRMLSFAKKRLLR